MSRVGKQPIKLPEGIEIQVDNSIVKVSKDGKSLLQVIQPGFNIKIDQETKTLLVECPSDSKMHRSLHGLYRALINNMVMGLSTGFEKKLEIIGVGYRAELKGKNLSLNIGYSHPILFKPPHEIEITLESPTIISVRGISKQLVGQVAAKIRSFRSPEPYKGKGIRYLGEHIRRKAGKAAG